jgi:hypothetical protein
MECGDMETAQQLQRTAGNERREVKDWIGEVKEEVRGVKVVEKEPEGGVLLGGYAVVVY